MSSELRQKALRQFKSSFDSSPCFTAYAPGTITLLGNGRDEDDGNAVSVAIGMGTVVAGTLVAGNVHSSFPLICRCVVLCRIGRKRSRNSKEIVRLRLTHTAIGSTFFVFVLCFPVTV